MTGTGDCPASRERASSGILPGQEKGKIKKIEVRFLLNASRFRTIVESKIR